MNDKHTITPERIMSKSASHVAFTKSEIAFVDPSVPHVKGLLKYLRPELDAIVLKDTRSAPAQIADVLRRRGRVETVHVIAHGRPGEVSFAAGPLSLDTVDSHDADLADIGHALGSDGALLLWSCRTGADDRGASFVTALARATPASPSRPLRIWSARRRLAAAGSSTRSHTQLMSLCR
jgi:hypothetical protein